MIPGNSIFKFECIVCDFKTNSKKEFHEHVSFFQHRDAALKKIKEIAESQD